MVNPSTRTRVSLMAGFGILLIFVVAASVVGYYLMSGVVASQKTIVESYNVKKDLSNQLLIIVQRRFLAVSRMMHAEDIFAIEDLKMQRMEMGGYFVHYFQKLNDMPLSKTEQALLERLRHAAGRSAQYVDNVIEDLAQGRHKQAIDKFEQQGITGQEKVHKILRQFAALQEEHVKQAVAVSQNKQKQYYQLQLAVTLVMTLCGAGLAAYVTGRITRTERQLNFQRKQAVTTLTGITDTVITTDANDEITYINPAGEKLVGFNSNRLIGRPLDQAVRLVNEQGGQHCFRCSYADDCKTVQCPYGEYHPELHNGKGEAFVVQIHRSKLRHDNDTQVIGHVFVIRDVTTERQQAMELEWQAKTDTLTGLVNRSEFTRQLDRLMGSAAEGGKHVLCYLDLDKFKVVNDSCGHTAGDELLKQVSRLLHSHCRKSDILARMGGDEFALLMEECDVTAGERVAKQIIDSVSAFRFNWEGSVFTLGISIGLVAINELSGRNAAEVLQSADAACYKAKDQGRCRNYVEHPDRQETIRRTGDMNWCQKIMEALREDRFMLYAQVIDRLAKSVNCQRQMLEVLLRFPEEDKIVEGNAFLPAAERYQLMTEVDKWVVDKTFALLKKPHQDMRDRFQININLSAQTVTDADMADFIVAKIYEYSIAPGLICFELAEATVVGHLVESVEFVDVIKKAGCKFAIDDFGSGVSSFQYLQKVDVDFIKIDGQWVRSVEKNDLYRHMVASVHHMASLLDIETVAEHIDSDATLSVIRDIGIHYGQGFQIATPQPLTQWEHMLNREQKQHG